MKQLLLLLPLLGLVACKPPEIIIKSGFEEGTISLHRYSKTYAAKNTSNMFEFYIRQKQEAIEVNGAAGYWGAVDEEKKKLALLQSWQVKLPKGFIQFPVAITIRDASGKPQTQYGTTSEDGSRTRYVTCLDPSLNSKQRTEILEATKTSNPTKDFGLLISEKGSSLHSQGRPLLMDRMIDKACELFANH
tara:strand:+ start:228 stop:797 length:570 start_codon:yes stop_codon:yes gene_type:complete